MPRLAIGDPGAFGGLLQVRSLHPDSEGAAAGRVVGLIWRATDPRGVRFTRLAAFRRGAAPEGTSQH